MKMHKLWSRKYRPKNINDMIGDSPGLSIIKGMFAKNQLARSILIHGETGTGKTTLARVLARTYNEIDENIETLGAAHDILEENAADARGIDAVREWIETSKSFPQFKPFKIFIIDEVHMLTTQAIRSLLKPLEEPSAKTIFILCTNEIEKIPPEIINRCLKLELKLVDDKIMMHWLSTVCKREKVFQPITDYKKILRLVVQAASGQPRLALQNLETASLVVANTKLTKEQDLLFPIKAALPHATTAYAPIDILAAVYNQQKRALVQCFAGLAYTDYEPVLRKMLSINQQFIFVAAKTIPYTPKEVATLISKTQEISLSHILQVQELLAANLQKTYNGQIWHILPALLLLKLTSEKAN